MTRLLPGTSVSFKSICCVLALLTVACSKKTVSPPSYSMSAIAGVYTITDMQVTVNSQQSDIFAQMTPCARQDTYGFGADGTYHFGGSTNTGCSDPDDSGTWSLNDDIITIAMQNAGTATMRIVQLNNKTMVVKYNGPYNGGSADFTTTLTRQ